MRNLIITGLIVFCLAGICADPLVQMDLNAIEDLDGEIWQRAKIGSRNSIVLGAGKTGIIPIDVWWGETLRPAKGNSYLVKLSYRDTVDSPIIIKAFAGLPKYFEIHRIGGTGDKAWKVALLPLPWDMVMRVPGTDRTELQIKVPAGADVPFVQLQIVPGDPIADEKRWQEETRAWIKAAQAEKRISAKQPAADSNAKVPGNQAAVAYTRAWHDLINQTSVPSEAEINAPVSINMAMNEMEPAQFGVYARIGLKDVTVSLKEGLQDKNGNKLDALVEFRTAEYAVVSKNRIFPQRLWPMYAVDIAKGNSHLFWVTIETKKDVSAAGTYAGTIVIASGSKTVAELPLNVMVKPITLLTMNEAGLTLGGCTTGLLPAHEMEFLNRNNHNGINLWYYGFAPAITRTGEGEFDLDFTIQDDFMKHAADAGTANFVYFLGGNPYGFPDTMHIERELYRNAYKDGSDPMGDRLELLKQMCESPEMVNKHVRPLYVKWTEKFMSHAQENGWPEPILTPFDEPAKWVQGNWARANVYYYTKLDGRDSVNKVRKKEEAKFLADLEAKGITPNLIGVGGADTWIKTYFKDACAAIHEGWPKARIYGSIHHADSGIVFLDDVEVFCTNAIHEDNKLGDKVRAGGPTKTFWQYSGCGDSKPPAEARYTFGFYFAAFNSRGSLVWAYNWGKRFDTSSGSNWMYAYTTPYDVIPAPYMEGLREAWDDRRYIETLRAAAAETGKSEEVEALLNELFDQASKTRTQGGRDTVHDFWARTDDPAALDTMRTKVMTKLLEVSGAAE